MPRATLAITSLPVPAFHPERDALLAAIRNNPDDDIPRLVYADWQDEHGQPEHAELIRLQCEIKHLQGHANTTRRRKLRRRVTELLKAPALRAMARGPWACYPDLDRGFTHHDGVVVKTAFDEDDKGRWDVFGPGRLDVPSALPLDKVLRLQVKFWNLVSPELVAEVVGAPWFARAWTVEFAMARFGPGSLRRAARSPHLGGLRELAFWQAMVDAGELARMALAPAAGRLEELAIECDTLVTAGPAQTPDPAAFAAALHKIGRSPQAAGLTLVYIDSPQMSDAAARAFLNSPRFAGLASLRLPPRRLTKAMRAELRSRFGDRVAFHPF